MPASVSPSAPPTRLIVCDEPIDCAQVGDLVAYAKPGERRPLFRRVVSVRETSVFRPDLNVWKPHFTVTLAIHPRRHHPSASTDTLAGFTGDCIPFVMEVMA